MFGKGIQFGCDDFIKKSFRPLKNTFVNISVFIFVREVFWGVNFKSIKKFVFVYA